MRKAARRAYLVIVLLGAFMARGQACQPQLRADVPLTVADGLLSLTLEVNRTPATFRLDTGAARSLVTPAAVGRLGLRLDRWVSASTQGIGGIERHSVADPRALSLAGLDLRDGAGRTVLVVAPIGPPGASDAVDGLLGRDLLSRFGVEIDGPAARLRLWSTAGCNGPAPPPWRGRTAAIPALRAYGDALVIPVQADGVGLLALPDTGVTRTVLAAPGVAKLGLTEPATGMSRARGVGSFERPVWPVTLATLRVGDETARDVPAFGSRLHILPIVDLLLGADWFRAHRVWLSYATLQIFIQRGPIQPGVRP